MIDTAALRRHAWPIVCGVLLVVFGASRLYDLSSRPLHHDEGVNGVFLKNLILEGKYKYDPKNYHGPSLYYLQLIPTMIASYVKDGAGAFDSKSISGLTPISIRLIVAAAGIVILWLMLLWWPTIGKVGAATACLLAGLSCDLLFVSRYFIHEIYVGLFTLGIVQASFRFAATRRIRYVYLAAVSTTMLFCTKETSLFHLLILALAWLCSYVTKWFCDGGREPIAWKGMLATCRQVVAGMGEHTAMIVGICGMIWVLLYSSMFSNMRGPFDSLLTYFYWGAEGLESGHEKNFFYYLTQIVLRYETVLAIFATIGVLIAFARNEMRGLFLAYWTLGMTGFYSLVPYKTPWLVINMVIPMALAGGYGVQCIVDELRSRLSRPHSAVVIAAMAFVGLIFMTAETRRTIRVNYKEYDSDRHPQVYAHTLREINDLVAKIDAAAAKLGSPKKMTINVFSDTYWPIPFYLMKYPGSAYWGAKLPEGNSLDAPVLLVSTPLKAQVDSRIKDIYTIKPYTLRPGHTLHLYLSTNLSPSQATILRTLDLLVSQSAPGALKPGLKLEVFDGVSFAGKPKQVLWGDTSFDFNWDAGAAKKYQSPFSLRWTGYIDVPKKGLYKFALESDDGSWLSLDDTPVIDNGGDHPVIKISRGVQLSQGLHKIELKYYDALGGAVLHFTWSAPDGKESQVPATVFLHKP